MNIPKYLQGDTLCPGYDGQMRYLPAGENQVIEHLSRNCSATSASPLAGEDDAVGSTGPLDVSAFFDLFTVHAIVDRNRYAMLAAATALIDDAM